MSLLDEYFKVPWHTNNKNLCIDEVAKDEDELPSAFREEARKSLFLAGKRTPEEIDRVFMEAVKNEMMKKEGAAEAGERIGIFQNEKNCH